jgi:hypothetical protein
MATTINSANVNPPTAKVDFSWTPVGAAITYSFAGNSYPPAGTRFQAFYTPVNQVLTFAAAATPATGTSIVLYKWDMGDGQIMYGPTVGHTYSVPNQSLTCKLEVTDSLNRVVYVSKVLLLQVQFATALQDHIRV